MNAPLPGELAELKNAIAGRHLTIHAFCKRHQELSRSTVYQVLAGRYAGNMARQAAKIRAALEAALFPEAAVSAGAIAEVLQGVKCERCRRADRRGCRGCRIQTGREAEAVARLFTFQGDCHGVENC